MQKNISVIIVANNNPESLEKVIWSYNTQTFRNFEVIIVNKNSSNSVLEVVKAIEKEVFFPMICVNSTEENSENNYIKQAVEVAATNYILVTNSNCLPRPDFIEQHIKNRVEEYFLIGTSFEIPKKVSDKITKDVVYSSQCFDSKWLQKNGLKSFINQFFITSSGLINSFFDEFSTINLDHNATNWSFWKSDFDKTTNYDTSIINQFINNGLKSKCIKYRAILLKVTN